MKSYGPDPSDCFLEWPELVDLLQTGVAEEAVEVWHTGGGNMNPVIVLERDAGGAASLYVMFSMGWGWGEASFALYREQDGEGWDEPQAEYYSDAGPLVWPGIRALLRERLPLDALVALAAREVA